MRFSDSRDPNGLGILILRHDNYDEKGFDHQFKGGILGVRVDNRDDLEGGLGAWRRAKTDGEIRRSVGDLNLALLWTYETQQPTDIPEKQRRAISGFAFAWPVLTKPGTTNDVATPGGGAADTCAVAPAKTSMRPIWDKDYKEDKRFKVVESPARPKRDGKDMWPKFPVDIFGIAMTTTQEHEQNELFLPTDPRHVAVNRKGDAQMGSLVCDMDDDFKIDLTRMARLQSKDWVLKEPKTCNSGIKANAIAWNIGPSGCGDTRGGFVFEKRAQVGGVPTPGGGGSGEGGPVETLDVAGILKAKIARLGNPPGGGIVVPDAIEALQNSLNLLGGGGVGGGGAGAPPPSVGSVPQATSGPGLIALISHFDSGHSDVGSSTDKHGLGEDADGHRINSLHISTNAYHRRDDTFDAPLEFGGFYVRPERGRYLMPTYLRYDGQPMHPHACGPKPGLWRWESECCIHIPEMPAFPVLLPPPPVATGAGPGGPPGGGDGGGGSPPTTGDPGVPTIIPVKQWYPGRFDRYAATEMAFSMPALIFRPQDLSPNAVDLRQAGGIVPKKAQQKADFETPATARIEAFGYQTNKEWRRTQALNKGRFPGGTANGGLVLMPPEFDITDFADNFSRNSTILAAVSTTYFTAVPGAYWAGGIPVPSTGGIKTGYRWGVDSSGNLNFDNVNSSGTATTIVTLDSTGGALLPADSSVKMGSGSGEAKIKGTIYSSIDAVGNVGAGEDTLHTFDLSANALSSDDSVVHLSAHGSIAGAANVTLKFHFGSSATTLLNAVNPGVSNWAADINIIRVNSGTQTIRIRLWVSSVDSSLSGASYTRILSAGASETDTAAITAKFTGEATNNNDIVQNMTVAEFYNAP